MAGKTQPDVGIAAPSTAAPSSSTEWWCSVCYAYVETRHAFGCVCCADCGGDEVAHVSNEDDDERSKAAAVEQHVPRRRRCGEAGVEELIEMAVEAMDLPVAAVARAIAIFRADGASPAAWTGAHSATAAACLSTACQQLGCPRTPVAYARALGVSIADIGARMACMRSAERVSACDLASMAEMAVDGGCADRKARERLYVACDTLADAINRGDDATERNNRRLDTRKAAAAAAALQHIGVVGGRGADRALTKVFSGILQRV